MSSCLHAWQIFIRVPEVLYTTYSMGTWDLPDIYANALGPGLCIHIRQIPHAHVITITCTLLLWLYCWHSLLPVARQGKRHIMCDVKLAALHQSFTNTYLIHYLRINNLMIRYSYIVPVIQSASLYGLSPMQALILYHASWICTWRSHELYPFMWFTMLYLTQSI